MPGSLSRYSSRGSRGVACTSKKRLPSRVNRRVTGNCKQITPLFGPERLPHRRPCRLRQVPKPRLAGDRNVLRHSVVVIAPDGISRVFHRPANTGTRIGPVVDEIAQTETHVERLFNRRECRPVGVDIRDDKNPHASKIAGNVREGQRSFTEMELERNTVLPSITNCLIHFRQQ